MDTSSLLTEKNIRILEILTELGDIHQKEIAKKIGLTDASTKLILERMEKAKVIKSYLSRDNGRIVKKIKLRLDRDDVKKLIKGYRETQVKLNNAIAALRKPELE